jgi:hypothetical protein
VVVVALRDADTEAGELGCDRKIIRQGGDWIVVPREKT